MRVSTAITGVLCLLLFSASPLQAQQQQKIGYVNSDHLLSQMPDYEGIRQQLRMMGEDWKKKLEAMQEEIDRKKAEFQEREILYGESVRKQREEEINALVNRREQFMEEKFGTGGEYFQKQQELLKPLQQKIIDAVRAVADRQDFDFVFDRARQTSMLYGNSRWDLNEEVLRELGITPGDSGN